MGTAIDANAPLDYIEFDIFPSQNRYDATVCYLNKKEKVSSGLLEQLLLLSPEIRTLHSKGSNVKYRLSLPENSHDIKWFTKSTLIRFLHIISSPNILEVTNSMKNEISQLEESRRFHLSLYTKGTKSQHILESDGRDSKYPNCMVNAEGSDASMNELLCAMDSRLTTLRGELMAAFDQAAGSRYSVEEMTDIEKFSQHFGSRDLSDSLRKHIELMLGTQLVENSGSNQFPEGDRVTLKEENNHISEFSCSESRVRYGASPAKVALAERQSSTGSDESSLSSEEEQHPERSRPLVRSASPRRSASPMRRVQIGRSGTRRSTAITIKSLNNIPARERSFLPKDAAASDSEERGSPKESKKSDSNVRISVQDAISLFESKQRSQKMDIQKSGSSLNTSVGANKSVLRRWSTGMGEDSSECQLDISAEDAVNKAQNSTENREIRDDSQEPESKPVAVLEDNPIGAHELDTKLEYPEKSAFGLVVMQEETVPAESADVSGKLTASAEWNRQKEVELNDLLMKMMETKPVKGRNVVPDINKRHSLPSEQRGGLYDNYREKRDEKLRGATANKRMEKDKQFGAMQQIQGARKSQPASANASDAVRKHNVKKMQKPQRTVAEPARAESPKPGSVKKTSSSVSSLPAAHKSLPSLPSPRAPGSSPARTPPAASSTSTTPTRRRSQPTPPVSLSNPKMGASQKGSKSVKSKQNDSKKNLGNTTEKQQQSVTRPKKTVASKVQTAPDDLASAVKPSLYSKVTKKSSVVPLESKPFLRKGSGTASNANPSVKKKVSSSQGVLRKLEDMTPDQENVAVSNPSDLVNEEGGNGEKPEVLDCEASMRSPTTGDYDDAAVEPELKCENEETITPTAWVEKEQCEHEPVTSEDCARELVASAPVTALTMPVGASSPRVRYSLSQMLLEEISEPDVFEWGNSENPPQVVDHKDVPKGLKRLLKFARKSKPEANAGGWSSPSVFSEAEDDAEDSKFGNKRNADNLLRKASLHSKNNGHQQISPGRENPVQMNLGKFSSLGLSQDHHHHASASATTTKATRSFFSLSAFKGSR